MKKLFLLVLIFPLVLSAQEYPNSIKIRASSVVNLPVEIVKVSIHIIQTESDSKLAFSKHKMLHKKLLSVLSNFNIPDSAIAYSPFTINKIGQGKKNANFVTSQFAVVKLNSYKEFIDFQMTLLDSGLTNFSGTFGAVNSKKIREELYRDAYKSAVENAETIANSMDKKLGDVLEVDTRISEPLHYSAQEGRGESLFLSKSGLSDIKGTSDEMFSSIQIKTYIEVRFEILD